LNIGRKSKSIIGGAVEAKTGLMRRLLGECVEKKRWPQLIEVDDVWRRDVLALRMSINEWFLGGNGGVWGRGVLRKMRMTKLRVRERGQDREKRMGGRSYSPAINSKG
jgi:hypothetical protein